MYLWRKYLLFSNGWFYCVGVYSTDDIDGSGKNCITLFLRERAVICREYIMVNALSATKVPKLRMSRLLPACRIQALPLRDERFMFSELSTRIGMSVR